MSTRYSPRGRPLLSPHNEITLSCLSSLPSSLYSPPSPHRFGVPTWLSYKPPDPTGYGHCPSTKTWLYLCLRHYGVPHSFMVCPHFVPRTHITSWYPRLQTLGPDGSWPTQIDYTSGCPAQRANWPASTHWARIRTYFRKPDISLSLLDPIQ